MKQALTPCFPRLKRRRHERLEEPSESTTQEARGALRGAPSVIIPRKSFARVKCCLVRVSPSAVSPFAHASLTIAALVPDEAIAYSRGLSADAMSGTFQGFPRACLDFLHGDLARRLAILNARVRQRGRHGGGHTGRGLSRRGAPFIARTSGARTLHLDASVMVKSCSRFPLHKPCSRSTLRGKACCVSMASKQCPCSAGILHIWDEEASLGTLETMHPTITTPSY